MTETRNDRQPKSNIAPTDSKLYNLTNIHTVYTNNTYEIGSGQTKKKQTDNRDYAKIIYLWFCHEIKKINY